MHALTELEFHHRMAEIRGPALVLFTAPACGGCRRIKAALAAEPALFADVTLFEVDAGREMGLTREFEVFHLPSMFLFVDGEYHGALHAEALPRALRIAIDDLLAAPAAEAP